MNVNVTKKNNWKDFVVIADTAEERDRWLDALRTAAHVRRFDEHYEVGPELGRGTFSIVVQAREKVAAQHSQRRKTPKKAGAAFDVAVKIIEKKGLDDDLERAMLRQEISILRLLGRHDNLMRLLDVFEDEAHVWIVTELLMGGDLLQLLGPDEDERSIAIGQTRDIIKQVSVATLFEKGNETSRLTLSNSIVVARIVCFA